jgi:hypothetical protein
MTQGASDYISWRVSPPATVLCPERLKAEDGSETIVLAKTQAALWGDHAPIAKNAMPFREKIPVSPALDGRYETQFMGDARFADERSEGARMDV